jgi:hypothetical protein
MEKEEKINEKGKLGVSLSETEEIIGRLKVALDVKTDGQLADHLGISRQNIGAARKREDVPPGWIYKVAELTGCSMDWLGFGHGPKVRLAKIYSSEDKLLIRTINANIHAFCEAIDHKHRDQSATKELADLKRRLSMIEKKLQ